MGSQTRGCSLCPTWQHHLCQPQIIQMCVLLQQTKVTGTQLGSCEQKGWWFLKFNEAGLV